MSYPEDERLRALSKNMDTAEKFVDEYVRLSEHNWTILLQLRMVLLEQKDWMAKQLNLHPQGEC